MARISNDFQYSWALWSLGEFEQALRRTAQLPDNNQQIDQRLLGRLLDFQLNQRAALIREIEALRAEIEDYEQRTFQGLASKDHSEVVG